MLKEDFAESFKNDQHDTIQSTYFRDQCFRIFTVCCHAKSPNNSDIRNYNAIVVTESSDYDRVTSMSCLQKVVYKIEYMHERGWENVYILKRWCGVAI